MPRSNQTKHLLAQSLQELMATIEERAKLAIFIVI